jgi:flagellar protein FlaG
VEIGQVNPISEVVAVAATSPLSPQQRAEQHRLIQAVESLNKSQLFGQSSELTFSFERNSRKPVLRIVDKETKEVIRQIPPEYVLRLAEEYDSK